MNENMFASGVSMEIVTVEDPLQCAFLKSLETGSVMPLVKEELKLKIQSRRLSEGREEFRVEFPPPPNYELTEKEKEKIEIRKKRNRQSASKSRHKRKSDEGKILKKLEEQQVIHDNLKIEANALRNIKKLLQARIMTHLAECPKYNNTVLLQQKKINSLENEDFDRMMESKKYVVLPT